MSGKGTVPAAGLGRRSLAGMHSHWHGKVCVGAGLQGGCRGAGGSCGQGDQAARVGSGGLREAHGLLDPPGT